MFFLHIIRELNEISMADTKVMQQAPVSLTEGAIKQLQSIQKEMEVPEGHKLRVGVKGGGCSGYTYVLGFDEKKETDEEYEVGGIRIVMNKAHALYIMGMEIDFIDGLENRGFKYNNPNATDTCGCGTSFSA